MTNYAPGTRIIVRDEEWTIKKVERNKLGNEALYCYGVSPLVRNRDAIFLTDLESIAVVDPSETRLAVDASPMFARSLLYMESQWRRQVPTDAGLVAGSLSYGKRIAPRGKKHFVHRVVVNFASD